MTTPWLHRTTNDDTLAHQWRQMTTLLTESCNYLKTKKQTCKTFSLTPSIQAWKEVLMKKKTFCRTWYPVSRIGYTISEMGYLVSRMGFLDSQCGTKFPECGTKIPEREAPFYRMGYLVSRKEESLVVETRSEALTDWKFVHMIAFFSRLSRVSQILAQNLWIHSKTEFVWLKGLTKKCNIFSCLLEHRQIM